MKKYRLASSARAVQHNIEEAEVGLQYQTVWVLGLLMSEGMNRKIKYSGQMGIPIRYYHMQGCGKMNVKDFLSSIFWKEYIMVAY